MKVLAIIGSPRKNGNVSLLAENVLKGAHENGHDIELINLYDYNIEFCKGCWSCAKNGRCVINDDFEQIFRKVREADVIVLGSPVYWANVSAIMKNFLDRHTGYAMYIPPSADNFYTLSKWKKLKLLIQLSKKFGPKETLFERKEYILITASTVPFKHLMGEVKPAINAMKKYVKKLKGNVMNTLIFTDTLFQFKKKKRKKLMDKAYNIGKSINTKPRLTGKGEVIEEERLKVPNS
ncbi:MAG: hypothetical protein GF383_15475 [Candidatus Lokiarchaeota archaeon]|nr:hypothetical protein [Candidatus Lokiarchaeota archaeon]MBD3342950.1 hypothetical protein [Candidatus Lokiarchaeota archaeon]